MPERQAEKVRQVQELRRSSAAARHRDKSKYSRRRKHGKKSWS
jgi:hypothetical protein